MTEVDVGGSGVDAHFDAEGTGLGVCGLELAKKEFVRD